MKKRRIKRKIKKHFKWNGHIYLRVFVIVGVLVTAVWLAGSLMDKEGEHKEVVHALSGTPAERYQWALDKVSEAEVSGEDADRLEARLMMMRLARLGEVEDRPVGYGPAHYWLAKEALQNFDQQFMQRFPVTFPLTDDEAAGRGMLPSGMVDLRKTAEVLLAQRHLEHAVALSPELKEASLLLASTYVAQGRRNDAVYVLLNAVAHVQESHPSLQLTLANTLYFNASRTDDLALEEKAWHLFSSIGEDVNSGGERRLSVRIRYILSALFLRKYDNAEIAIRRLEAQHRVTGRQESEGHSDYNQVKALRAAYHYQRALDQFEKSPRKGVSGSEKYQTVVDELIQVINVDVLSVSAVDALIWMAKNDVSQQLRIKKFLQGLLPKLAAGLYSEKEPERVRIAAELKSKVSVALALMGGVVEGGLPSESLENTGAGGAANIRHLEAAVQSDPHNAEALLRLVEALLDEADRPGGAFGDEKKARLVSLAKDAVKYAQSAQKSACHLALGRAEMHSENWSSAIVAMEKSLVGAKGSKLVHLLLAKAYTEVGQEKMADLHRKQAER